ncbi:hypothetical protein BYT27DRAFT_7190359 [Phlegmacium glaucopus]|nr:hypothetical protein BYT27DRAFT_7190359 [Phlegmacium glaucopus]
MHFQHFTTFLLIFTAIASGAPVPPVELELREYGIHAVRDEVVREPSPMPYPGCREEYCQ